MSKHTCQEVLRKHMSPESYALFVELTTNLGAFPCEYDEQTGQFEPALDTLDPETAEGDTLDAVLTACDILTQNAAALDLTNVCHVTPPDTGSAELAYDFDSDDPALPIFLSLLHPMTMDDSYQINVQRSVGLTQVLVTLRFHGEHDFQTKKDQVHLARDIAERRVKERPFQGSKL